MIDFMPHFIPGSNTKKQRWSGITAPEAPAFTIECRHMPNMPAGLNMTALSCAKLSQSGRIECEECRGCASTKVNEFDVFTFCPECGTGYTVSKMRHQSNMTKHGKPQRCQGCINTKPILTCACGFKYQIKGHSKPKGKYICPKCRTDKSVATRAANKAVKPLRGI